MQVMTLISDNLQKYYLSNVICMNVKQKIKKTEAPD